MPPPQSALEAAAADVEAAALDLFAAVDMTKAAVARARDWWQRWPNKPDREPASLLRELASEAREECDHFTDHYPERMAVTAPLKSALDALLVEIG